METVPSEFEVSAEPLRATSLGTSAAGILPRRAVGRLILGAGNRGVALDYAQFFAECCGGEAATQMEFGKPDRAVLVSCGSSGVPASESFTPFQQISEAEFGHPDFMQRVHPSQIVVFLKHESLNKISRLCNQIAAAAKNGPIRCVVIIESVSIHLGDRRAAATQHRLKEQLEPKLEQLVIIRTGHILSPSSSTTTISNSLCGLHPLVSSRLTSTFVDGAALFAVIEQELAATGGSSNRTAQAGATESREITLLGKRSTWRSVLPASESESRGRRMLWFVCRVLAFVGFPWLIFQAIRLLSKFTPRLRSLHVHSLKPRSVRELISLCNCHNFRHVQIAGYNNGVNHFGWKFPGKTVVLTTGVPGSVHLSDAHVTVDAGLTLKHCIAELTKAGREFYVVPNYSWISMGTLFFVPVHGSGSHVSTLGDTIEEVLLYDCSREEFITARRDDSVFRETMYDTSRHMLLLRLTLRVKPRSVYFVRRSTIEQPTSDDIQKLFQDTAASNVEIRKNSASGPSIEVSRYYTDRGVGTADEAMEVPRDSIGRIWDRLEETPVVSSLFHWFVRTSAFHVELFLKPDEFAVFWTHHQSLPVSKIQLRRILKDGMTHSACRDENCISADLFMTRGNRDVFCQFITTQLPGVRSNPGKQSL